MDNLKEVLFMIKSDIINNTKKISDEVEIFDGDTVKITGKIIRGNNIEMELIPIGTICRVVSSVYDENEDIIVGVIPENELPYRGYGESWYPIYSVEKVREKMNRYFVEFYINNFSYETKEVFATKKSDAVSFIKDKYPNAFYVVAHDKCPATPYLKV
jgi:hypothetical protein